MLIWVSKGFLGFFFFFVEKKIIYLDTHTLTVSIIRAGLASARVNNSIHIDTSASRDITPLATGILKTHNLESFLFDTLRNFIILVVSSAKVITDVLHVLRAQQGLNTDTILSGVTSGRFGLETVDTTDTSSSIQSIPSRANQMLGV
jgi:hypothetical protein